MFKGKCCIKKFLDSLKEDVDKLTEILGHTLAMNLTEEERQSVNTATICHICEEKFQDQDQIVADHCHFTGKFRGPAHTTV